MKRLLALTAAAVLTATGAMALDDWGSGQFGQRSNGYNGRPTTSCGCSTYYSDGTYHLTNHNPTRQTPQDAARRSSRADVEANNNGRDRGSRETNRGTRSPTEGRGPR